MRLTAAVSLAILGLVPAASVAEPRSRPSPTISASADGNEIFVQFAGLRGAGDDWISVAAVGSPPGRYVAWRYTEGSREGALTLPAVPAGRYVARVYFGSSSYVVRAESSPFRVGEGAASGCSPSSDPAVEALADGGTVLVRFSGLCGAAQDWIAIADADSPAESYAAWTYTGGARQGTRTFGPLPPGHYVARVFFDWSGTHGYQVRARSQPFWIAPEGCVCGAAAGR